MLARSKLNSTESDIAEVKQYKNIEVNHEDFRTIINEVKKYGKLKESIRMINSQRNNNEKVNLVKNIQKK